MQPPQQRVLRARRRREQRGDEQAGAGAPRRAGLRGHAQPPRLRALPRAPREGGAEGRRRRRHARRRVGRRRQGGRMAAVSPSKLLERAAVNGAAQHDDWRSLGTAAAAEAANGVRRHRSSSS